jgi:hypothetical protein
LKPIQKEEIVLQVHLYAMLIVEEIYLVVSSQMVLMNGMIINLNHLVEMKLRILSYLKMTLCQDRHMVIKSILFKGLKQKIVKIMNIMIQWV